MFLKPGLNDPPTLFIISYSYITKSHQNQTLVLKLFVLYHLSKSHKIILIMFIETRVTLASLSKTLSKFSIYSWNMTLTATVCQ